MSDLEEDFEDVEEDSGEEDSRGESEKENEIEDGLETEEPKALRRTQSYEVLPEQEVITNAKEQIQYIMSVCAIPTVSAARMLLRSAKWNKDKVVESYLEDSQKACRKAGMSTLDLEKLPSDPSAVHECLICMNECKDAQTYALSCGHRYCKECWKGYLEVKIKDGATCVYAKCPAPKCGCMIHEAAYKQLVSESLFEKYNYYLNRSFVEDNEFIKWCPAPSCSNAIRCERPNKKTAVTCSCGFSFCFRCADYEIGDHNPASCESLEKWLQKASDESENVNWLIANTKKCPKCRSPIEKNGGCMHMTCQIPSCSYEFCWMCRGPWSEHGQATGGYYQCNKYDASEAKKEDASIADVKTELETYMFYFHRYESHKNAGKIAHQQRQNCLERERSILDKFEVRSQDTKFLSEATEQLIKNRRVLQYSYVMGYYLDKTKTAEKNLFEYLQEDLEKHTNHLSELYEQNIENIKDYHKFMEWKESVTNYTRVTKKFLDNFLNGIADGLTVNS